MQVSEPLADAFGRIAELVADVVDGLSADDLTFRVDPEANTIAWLVWHLTRIQDDHVSDVAGTEQVWTSQGWARRFDLPFEDSAHGYGHDSEDVAAVAPESPDLLADYHDAVYQQTLAYLDTVSADDLDRVVDKRWDPPVTLAARLVSVVSDDLQHVGQAAFIRGVLDRSR